MARRISPKKVCLCVVGLGILYWLKNTADIKRNALWSEQVGSSATNQSGRLEAGELAWIVNTTQVRMWIDVPNALTQWRFCLQEYSGLLTLLWCGEKTGSQIFSLEPVTDPAGRAFKILLPSGQCLSPQEVLREGSLTRTVSSSAKCPGHWLWTTEGQLRWRGPVPWQRERVSCGMHEADSCAACPRDPLTGQDLGSHMCHGQCLWEQDSCRPGPNILQAEWPDCCPLCLTSVKINQPVTMARCRELSEEQMVEVGHWTGQGLIPRDLVEWRSRQDRARDLLLAATREPVSEALEWIQRDKLLHLLEDGGGRVRRAVVLYLDQGTSGLQQLHWWIRAWTFVGLDQTDQAFDVVVMAHPDMIEKVAKICTRIADDFSPRHSGPGRCLYKPYIGVASRDSAYDKYMSSQECLVGPGSEFLQDYRTLLRADLDTFPTPRLLGFWPEGVLVDRHSYHTNFGLASINQAIKRVAYEAGVEHHGWHNPGSTWYGDARRVRHLARLTVALNQFGRTLMFGPGTTCRCASCSSPPKECGWGGGPYPGVQLLYMQEIAVNAVLSPAEWKALPPGLFDQGTQYGDSNVCQPALLHCYHHEERFSKFAFAAGKYRGLDMKDLDLTKSRDFATYIALTANGQGVNERLALEQFNKKSNNASLADWCRREKKA